MPMSPTPEKIRAVVKRLTGVSVQGAVKRGNFQGMDVCTCIYHGTAYHCTYKDESWLVFSELPNNDGLQTWTDKIAPATRIVGDFARYVLREHFGDAELTFEHELVESHTDGDVLRRTFSSPLGPVVVHSRKIGGDTEMIIQASSRQWIGRFLQKGKTGQIDLSPTLLTKLPF
jgi:hypothetical protein